MKPEQESLFYEIGAGKASTINNMKRTLALIFIMAFIAGCGNELHHRTEDEAGFESQLNQHLWSTEKNWKQISLSLLMI